MANVAIRTDTYKPKSHGLHSQGMIHPHGLFVAPYGWTHSEFGLLSYPFWFTVQSVINSSREYQRTLVAAINAELGGLGWTRKQLADEIGISEQSLMRYFNLKRDMNIEQFAQIAGVLGVTPEYLVDKARVWSERTTPDDLVDASPQLTARQKASLRDEIAEEVTKRGNNGPERNDSELPVRSDTRPAI